MTTLFNQILVEVRLSYNLNMAKGKSDMHDYKVARLFSIPFMTKRVTVSQEI